MAGPLFDTSTDSHAAEQAAADQGQSTPHRSACGRSAAVYVGRSLAWLGLLVLGLSVLGWLWRSYVVQGWVLPVRVVSSSMAPQLYGPGHSVTCGDCGFGFRFGGEPPPPADRAVCPNCGSQVSSATTAVTGQRVFIDKWSFRRCGPRRFEVVAALVEPTGAAPAAASTSRKPLPTVKRVAGLPGESLCIKHGDLYADGRLVRKNLATLKLLAILVHDDRYRIPGNSRWSADDQDTRWSTQPHGFRFSGPGAAAWDWLEYEHTAALPPPHVRGMPAPLMDNYGYNQGASRSLNVITDYFVAFALRIDPASSSVPSASTFAVRWDHPQLSARWEWSPAKQQATLFVGPDSSSMPHAQVDLTLGPQELHHVVFGTWDRQLVLAIDEQEVLRTPFEPFESESPSRRPIAIGCRGAIQLSIADLKVWRDIHYTKPIGVGAWQTETPLAADEYLLLGDNSPYSFDGRLTAQGAVRRHEILGLVIPWTAPRTYGAMEQSSMQ